MPGWGSLNAATDDVDPIYPDVLQEARITLLSQETCIQYVEAPQTPEEDFIEEHMICAANLTYGGVDTCVVSAFEGELESQASHLNQLNVPHRHQPVCRSE